jgi:hypothetical protein
VSQQVKVVTVDGHDLLLEAEFLNVCSVVKKKVEGKLTRQA